MDKIARRFVGMSSKGRYITETPTSSTVYPSVYPWVFAVKVPEPKLVPWTFDTCPLPPFCVRNKVSGAFVTVQSINPNGVYMGSDNEYSYPYLMAHYEYCITRETIRPCGEVK